MRVASYVQIVAALLVISTSTASAGISDIVGDTGSAENLSALTDPNDPLIVDMHPPRLTLDAPRTEFENPPQLDNQIAPTAVTAPLPAALIPGACLLAGNFVLAKALKRRLR